MNVLSLFAGIGGIDLAFKRLGHRTICYVELDDYCRAVLLSRMADGGLDRAPVWGDVRTFDGKSWVGRVDCIAGGFPCQDVSVAGKQAGLAGARSGLWSEFARIIREVRPRLVFVENVPGLLFNGMDVVLGDLAALGFNARWGVLSASDVAAPHRRERVWIVADAYEIRCEVTREAGSGRSLAQLAGQGRWPPEPDMGRVAHGIPARVDRLRALGNAVVPQAAQEVLRQWTVEELPEEPDDYKLRRGD